MSRLCPPLLAGVVALALASPASAHSLRLFAKTDGQQVSGYGFFVGGGRPQGVAWVAVMGDTPVAQGTTDAKGGFAFAVPARVTGPITLRLDTAEGHMASTTLPPDRFSAAPRPPDPAPTPSAAPSSSAAASALTEAQLEAALARQVAPLSEQIAQMDARLRLADLMSGIFLIIGLAGIALWARGRSGRA